MERKYLRLKENEEITISGSNNDAGVLIKNQNNRLIISEITNLEKENIYIKNIDNNFLTSFVLIKLLENNDLSLDNSQYINNILDNYYKALFDEYLDKEIENITFQCITEYKN